MDYKRVALTAVVAWVVDSVYGMTVFMGLLGNEMGKYPALFRSQAAMTSFLPLMFLGSLVGFLVLAYMYAKGYEGGSGLTEGFRFGLLIAILLTGFMSIGIYSTFNVDGRLAIEASVATFVEFVVDGIAIGLVYRGAPARVPAHA
jgi:hypothetical protein